MGENPYIPADYKARLEARKLPPVTVARFEQVTILIERLAQQKTAIFLDAMTGYAESRAQATARTLTHTEAANAAGQIAAALRRDDPAQLAAEIQQSGLKATDPPEPRELLLAAGLRTAPAFLDAALQVCAMIEASADEFHEALEADNLDALIGEITADLRLLTIQDGRARASAALDHFTQQVGGTSPGEAWSLLTNTVWQAIRSAMSQLASASPWSTSLLKPTDGPNGTSSGSDTGEPSTS